MSRPSRHGPQVPWFESADLEAHLARTRPDPQTEAFIREMARRGGATVDLGDVGRALCDRAVADTDPYFADGTASRIQDAWLISSAVRKLANLAQIKRLLKAAYGRKPFPFQTLNFHRGSQQAIHCDTIHFSSQPERFMAGVWIALEDIRPEAGPVVYKPGSHTQPILKMRDVGVNSSHPTTDDYVIHYIPRLHERLARLDTPDEPAILKKGQAFVWASNLAHGGSPIQDPASTRRSLVVHFYFDDCAYYTPMFSDEAGGRLHLRLPMDLGNGLWRWPRMGGKRMPLEWPMVWATLRNRRHSVS